jgi:hypothetical protein
MAYKIIDWFMYKVMPWAFILLIISVGVYICLCAYGFFVDSQKPTLELKKEEWVCTDNRKLESTYYVKVGAVMVPHKSYSDVCFNWKRIE